MLRNIKFLTCRSCKATSDFSEHKKIERFSVQKIPNSTGIFMHPKVPNKKLRNFVIVARWL